MPIGPAPSRESYLRIDKIVDAAKKSGAEAVHPGYGFLAENADFAQACIDAGLIFVGPSPDAIRAMGSKTESRQRMKTAGVPIVPGLERAVESSDELIAFAEQTGFPIMLKASAGGGGKGMRRIDQMDQLLPAFERVSSEALSFFGDAAVYAEKLIDRPRHIEVQVLGDQHGNLVHLLERECSLQRRNQKVIEECPSPVVSPELRAQIGEAAVKAARAVNYHNAGTIEFLMAQNGEFYFLEMNTRLQVEHPVTELVTGVDIVKQQLLIAQGAKLPFTQEDIKPVGHAIECRVYAEDPFRNFAPSPGQIRYLIPPQGPGVRNDNGVYTGFTVPIHYDPMLSKLITYGADRTEAITRMKRALAEYRVEGIETSMPFYSAIMDDAEFQSADFDTGYIERFLARTNFESAASDERSEAAIVAAAIFAFEESQQVRLPIDRASAWKRAGMTEAMRGRS